MKELYEEKGLLETIKRQVREMVEEEKYFMISGLEGSPTLREFTKPELNELLNEELKNGNFLEKIEKEDLLYWNDECLIIKGKIITPRPVTTITELEID